MIPIGPAYATNVRPAVAMKTRDSNSDLDQRQRYSPIIGWRFAPSGQLRLQYNYDKADHLNEVDTKDDPSAHAFWFGLDWSFGAGSKVGHHHDH